MTNEDISKKGSPFFTADMTIEQKLQMLNFNIQALRVTNEMHERRMHIAAERMSEVRDSLDYDVIVAKCETKIAKRLLTYKDELNNRVVVLERQSNENFTKLNGNIQNFKTKMKKDCEFDRQYATGTHTLLCKTIIRIDKIEEGLKGLGYILKSKEMNLLERFKTWWQGEKI